MRFLAALIALFIVSANTAQANMFKYLVCEDLQQLAVSLDAFTSVRQVLESEESVLAPGCRYSNLATYSYMVYDEWWYYNDAGLPERANDDETLTDTDFIFNVDRIKLINGSGEVVDWYRMSKVTPVIELDHVPTFNRFNCLVTDVRRGCFVIRARAVEALPPGYVVEL